MKGDQNEFILKQLDSFKVCEIKENHIKDIDKITTSVISNILNKNFVSGNDMKAVLCLFDTFFSSFQKKKKKGIYNLPNNIHKWIKNIVKLKVSSQEGFVYVSDFFSSDIKVIIKVPQDVKFSGDLIKEYFIGVCALNKLRQIIPTFVYTLGSFICSGPNNKGKINKLCGNENEKYQRPFIVYEKINGTSADDLLSNNDLNFEEWLVIFIQLLLSLEVAQREVQFTHFDLHCGNVMVRKNDTKYKYSVPLDDEIYTIENPSAIPSIIDFGLSSAYINENYIGYEDMEEYGILKHMVPGYDMYKFLIYSLKYCRDSKLRGNIISMFGFYGKNDPYNIFNDFEDGLDKATDDFCADVTNSPAANYTPLNFLNWIYYNTDDKISSIAKKVVDINKRNYYAKIFYSSAIKEYEKIFNKFDDGLDRAVNIIEKCVNKYPSYIMTKYNIKLLENYNIEMKSSRITSNIKDLKIFLEKYGNYLLKKDQDILEKVFEIQVPEQNIVTRVISGILSCSLLSTEEDKNKAIESFNIMDYEIRLKKYLQFHYTIIELGLLPLFKIWNNRFLNSNIYLFYIKNNKKTERSRRWVQTLSASKKADILYDI